MNDINLDNVKKRGIYFKTINMDKLYDELEMKLPQMYVVNDERKKEILMERKEKIEDKMINVMTDSKQNINNTVHIINNVKKQLIQNNLLLRMKIENMKQTYKNILNYCTDLQSEINLTENKELHGMLSDIINNLKIQVHKIKEER